MESSNEEKRIEWFDWYAHQLDNNSTLSSEVEKGPFACPCCKFLTLTSRGHFDLCPVCYWEDDGQDDHDADVSRGGPNGGLSLTKARAIFLKHGASDEDFIKSVRKPLPEEVPAKR